MLVRESIENEECEKLSKYAALSVNSQGRIVQEEKCDIRTIYQRDRDRILHSKAFRRLKHKTQVFLSPEGDHYRTRLTHTLEVAQIARTIARALKLNEDLVEAIALGHDLGHTPFGHSGENILNELNQNGFRHNEYSLLIVDKIEEHKNRNGLNLSYEVRDGILNHTGNIMPCTLEGQIVKIADRIGYLNHDIDDAIRAGIFSEADIPQKYLEKLGYSHGERIETMIIDVIHNSKNESKIRRNPEIEYYSDELRKFMFKNVYYNQNVKSEESKAKALIKLLYNYYKINFKDIPKHYSDLGFELGDCITFYIAGMTDRYAIKKFKEIYIPSSWNIH